MRSSRGGSRAAHAIAIFVAIGTTVAAQTPKSNPKAERALAAELSSIFGASVMAHAQWGVEVKSLDTGKVIYALNARKLMMPASNMKIVTVAAAAEILGWDHRFKTTLETAAPIEGHPQR